jgi:FkbM family methyltransferase
VEYYWTLTATILLHLLERYPDIESLTYVDSDLMFFSSPQPVYDELGAGSILIHEHRFSEATRYLEPLSGRFNVGLMVFRNDVCAHTALRWWRDRCNEWCYNRYENGKIGDQGYLGDWPTRFPGVVVLENTAAGVAPWNHDQYALGRDADGVPTIDGRTLIFYHYHALSWLNPDRALPFKHTHYQIREDLALGLFPPYLEALRRARDLVHTVHPEADFGFEPDQDITGRALLVRDAAADLAPPDHVRMGANGAWTCFLPPELAALSAPQAPKAADLAPPPAWLERRSDEPLRDYLARPVLASQIRTLYFIGCHTFHEREWFFNTFRHLEHLYLFEPLPNVRAQLEQDFAGHPVVKVFPYAISDHDGQAVFHVTNNLQSSSLLNMKEHKQLFPGVDAIGDIAVPQRCLETVIRDHGLADPDLLFIDVQGAEFQVLTGIARERLERVGIVFTEASTVEVYEGAKLLTDLNDYLGSAFHFIGFEDMLGSKVHGDALFLNRDLERRLPSPEQQVATLCEQGRDAEARRDYGAAMLAYIDVIELDPGHLEAINHLAMISARQGKTTEALQLLEHALSLSPDDPETRRNQADLLGGATPPTPAAVPVAARPRASGEYKITAVVSSYNSAAFIGECLEDLVSQTIAEQIEIFVLDAHSPQNEKAVVEKFQVHYPNIRYLRTPKRIGVYAAWNLIAREARGEYLISCSTNDRLAGNACEILAGFLDAHPETALVYGNSYLVDQPHQRYDNHVISDTYLWPPYSYAMLTRQCLVGPHPMWRRALHDELGWFDESYTAIGDQDFWLRVGYGHEIRNLSVFTGLYYVSPQALSRDMAIVPAEVARVHAAHLPQRVRRILAVAPATPEVAVVLPRTHFLILMLVLQGEEALLADTLETLLAQSHEDWRLVVISDCTPLDSAFQSHPRLGWEPVAGRGLHGAADAVLSGTVADWVMLAEPGLAFAPEALREFATAAARQPQWQMIYCDDADLDPNCNTLHQRHKPEFCLDLLHRLPYLDNYVVQWDVLSQAGGIGAHIFAEGYDIALRLHDRIGAEGIGHLAQVLLRKSWGKCRPFHFAAGKTALQEHCQRMGLVDLTPQLLAAPYKKTYELLGERVANIGDTNVGAVTVDSLSDQELYALWQQGHSYLKRDALWIVERLDAIATKPRFHLVVIALPGQEDALANNIKSLGHQFYPDWRLTIVASQPAHEALDGVDAIAWHQAAPEALLAEANRALLEAPADWVGMIEAGDKLAPHALFAFADKAERHPHWQVLYSDEDKVDALHEHSSPFFKTDFNIEMLRAAPFAVGGLLMLRRDLFSGLGGFDPTLEGVEAFDLSLRAWEKVDHAGIGHIADVLYHRHVEGSHTQRSGEEVAAAHRRALAAHLARCGIAAELEEGQLPGTLHVRYPVLGNPLVSILIPTRNQVDMLKRCLTSLIEGTGYSNCEILVLDNGSDEAEAVAYLGELQALNSPRLKVLECPGPFNFSAINNRGAAAATGDFLLLLNNDTAVLHEDWLEEMLGIAQQADVGAVGAKLFYPNGRLQHAGVILGMKDDPAEHPYLGQEADSDGYFGRARLAQEYTAVTGACLLVRRALYLEFGGLDEERYQVAFNDVDFCLRLQRRGKRNVFTPHARLLHESSASLRGEVEGKPKPEQIARLQVEKDRFMDAWRHEIAFDPAFNRNLSSHSREFQIEIAPALTWDPEWRPRPRVLAHPADRFGCGEYRVVAPMRALNEAGRIMGWDTGNYLSPVELFRMEPDSILLQRQVDSHQLELIERYIRHSKAFRVYEIDDLITNIPVKSIRKKQFVEQKDLHKRFRKGIAMCHRFIVSTDYLAEQYQGYCDDIVVVPNYVERARWGELKPSRRHDARPRVGWAGSITHDGDLAMIFDVVKATAKEVDWVFFGMCPDEIRPYVAEFVPGVSLDDYPAKLASLDLDLAVAPLEDVPFNHGKSHLRLLEYGVLGYPVICTDITPYRGDYPVTRVPNKFKSWVDSIRSHVADRDELARRGDALRDYINANWILEDHLDIWQRAWLP